MQAGEAALNQRFRVRISKDNGTSVAYWQGSDECLGQVCYAPCALQQADDFPFVVGNGKFIQRADPPGEQQDDVSASYGDDVTSFEPKTRLDYHG